MKKGSSRLVLTAVMLLVSLVLLVSASMAWLTLSTAPEITGMKVTLFTDRALLVSVDGKNFDQSIDLSEIFRYYAPLKPVSSVDGVNWFLPSYTTDGLLKDPSEFLLDNTLEHGNVMVYEKNAQGKYVELQGVEYLEASNQGYYVYCDFYLMTELEEDVIVSLSAPDLTKNNLEGWETDENDPHGAKYGSYAMAAYEKDSENNIYSIDNNAQTALRVGFLINKGGTDQRFVIYEPNADQRSAYIDKPHGDTDYYVHGFQLLRNPDYVVGGSQPMYLNYIDNSYIPTKPIGITASGEVKPMEIDPKDLMIQMAGQWDQTKLQEAVLAGQKPNSNDVAQFGKFVKDSGSLTLDETLGIHKFEGKDEMDLASGSYIVKLQGKNPETGETYPQKVTMFIWLEGQDADCWNDIASGSFVVNLEFAAQS